MKSSPSCVRYGRSPPASSAAANRSCPRDGSEDGFTPLCATPSLSLSPHLSPPCFLGGALTSAPQDHGLQIGKRTLQSWLSRYSQGSLKRRTPVSKEILETAVSKVIRKKAFKNVGYRKVCAVLDSTVRALRPLASPPLFAHSS